MSSKIKYFYFLITTLLFFIFTTSVYASSISLSSSQTTLSVSEEFVVDVQLSINATDGTIYYLRGEFYLTDGQYCGYTWNGNSWFNASVSGDGYKNLQQISITNDAWVGQLKAKIDPSDSSCANSGNYFFKIQRYTNTGNSSTDTMTPLTISVIIPTPTPSPSPTSTPIPTNPPVTQTSTSAPTVKPTPTKSPTSKPTVSPTPTEESEETDEPTISISDINISEATPTGLVAGATTTKKSPVVAIIFIVCGVLFLGYGGFLLYNMKHKNEEINGEQDGENS